MTIYSDSKVRKSLERKGFKQQPGRSKHIFYYLYDEEGKRTAVNTHVSKNGQDIGDNLIKQMAIQTKLSKQEFKDLIECPLTKEMYYTILRAKGAI